MATYTENYNLLKPETEEYFNIEDFNTNFDTVDATMFATEQAVTDTGEKIDALDLKIGKNDDGDTTTVFGQLNDVRSTLAQGISLVKSIQYVVYNSVINESSGTVSIATVNPARSFVIFERLKDSTDGSAGTVTYTLNASSITVKHSSYNTSKLTLGFWVIEFN